MAEANASSQNNASVAGKKYGVGIASATPASATPSSNCIVQIHYRRVFKMSTAGLHSGLMTHGR